MTVTVTPAPATRRGWVLATMCVGMFLVLLDVTVVNVALPDIRDGLGTSLAGQQWVVDAYAVVLAALLLLGGATGDRWGHRRVVVVGLAVFALASLLCGLAPGVGALVVGRALQGIGAAALLPGTLAVIARTYPGRAEQARALGVWAGVSSFALPAGPVLGGLLVSTVGWRSVFLLNLPVVAVALPAVLALVPVDRPDGNSDGRRRLDLAGAVLAALALGAAVFAVIGLERGIASPTVWVPAALAIAAVTGFVIREHRATEPVLPLALLRAPAFVGATLVAAAMNLVGIGVVFVATLYLQTVQHRAALVAGVLLLPLFVPLAGLAPVTGRIVAHLGPRPPMTAGLVLGVAGSLALIGLRPESGYVRLLPVLLGLGLGMGLLTAAVVAAAVRALPADRSGLAGGVNNTARQTAGALAVALFGVMVGSPTDGVAFTVGLHHVGVLGAVVWTVALVLTWTTLGGQRPR